MAVDYNRVYYAMPWVLKEEPKTMPVKYDTSRPFRFQDLPPEVRNRIYDLALDMSVIRPKFELPADAKYTHHSGPYAPSLSKILTRPAPHPRTEYVFVGQGPGFRSYDKPAKPTAPPALLGVSKAIRHEGLSVYYNNNTFIFYGCSLRIAAKWIVNKVGEHKKHLQDVYWMGPQCSFTSNNIRAAAVILLLNHKGILKSDPINMSFRDRLPVKHPLCGLKEALIKAEIFGDKTAEEVDKMKYAELDEAVKATAKAWWAKYGIGKTKEGKDQKCVVCGAEPEKEKKVEKVEPKKAASNDESDESSDSDDSEENESGEDDSEEDDSEGGEEAEGDF